MKYDAFISYRHLERDMFVAKGIHKALETTKIPIRIQKEAGKKKIKRVFRDQEELPIGSNLGDNIEAALADSEFLVVICSPQTKESAWVMKEIDTFISLHGRKNLLAVLVDGEPEDSFPPQLLVDDEGNPREPLAADVRGSSKKEVRKKIKSESMRLAASIIYCDYDDLRRRHRERVMRRYIGIAAGVAVLGVLFGIYNAYNLARINENYQQKLINESKVIAATSADVLATGDRKTAALLALEALPSEENDRPLVANAVYALSEALGSYTTGGFFKHDKILSHKLSVNEFKVNSDKSRILSYDNNDNLYFWDVAAGELLYMINASFYEGESDSIKGIGLIDNHASVVTEHYFTVYEEDGSKSVDFMFDDMLSAVEYSPDSSVVAVSFRDSVVIYDSVTGKELAKFVQEELEFDSRMFFSSDNKHFIIGIQEKDAWYLDDKAEDMVLAVYDLETKDYTTVQTKYGYLLDACITPDDYLATATMRRDDLLDTGSFPVAVQKFDYKTGEEKWTTEVDRNAYGVDVSYTHLKSRMVDTSEGQKGEVLISASRTLYNLDLYTGEVTATFSSGNDIEKYYIAIGANSAYVGTRDGNIYIINGSTGYSYSDYVINVGDSLIDFSIGNGYAIAKKHLSPDLVVMSYVKDDAILSEFETEAEAYYMQASPDNSTYAAFTRDYSNDQESKIFVYDSETDKQIASFEVSSTCLAADMFYLDDNTIVLTDNDSNIWYYTIDSQKSESIKVNEESFWDFIVSENHDYIGGFDLKDYVIYDLRNKKLLYEGTFTDDYSVGSVRSGAITNSGNLLYYCDYNHRTYRYDFQEKKLTEICEDYLVEKVAVSSDNSLLAILCTDGKIRILNTRNLEVVSEAECYGGISSFMKFSEDSEKIYFQGSDYYFKIFDINSGAFKYISEEQLPSAEDVVDYPEKNLVAFICSAGMEMIDTESYGVLMEPEYGCLYLDKKDMIISQDRKQVYKFRVKSAQELIDTAKARYGNETLSDEQKLRYRLY